MEENIMFKNRYCCLLLLLLPVAALFGDNPTQLEQAAAAEYKQIVADHPGTDEALSAQEKLVGLYMKERMGAEVEAAYVVMLTDYEGNAGLAMAVDHVGDEYREIGDAYREEAVFYWYVGFIEIGGRE
jgi:hypothetical protein